MGRGRGGQSVTFCSTVVYNGDDDDDDECVEWSDNGLLRESTSIAPAFDIVDIDIDIIDTIDIDIAATSMKAMQISENGWCKSTSHTAGWVRLDLAPTHTTQFLFVAGARSGSLSAGWLCPSTGYVCPRPRFSLSCSVLEEEEKWRVAEMGKVHGSLDFSGPSCIEKSPFIRSSIENSPYHGPHLSREGVRPSKCFDSSSIRYDLNMTIFACMFMAKLGSTF
ncbi:unnamed protein product [Onchocerca flexuosa]|uniref:F5/8 type C domain-containing protein n=1 Tax=Onchocerca flexuosa TaxID=387005 RepID=A0A183HYF3_9BILA|nr:unnamed protein product [Onchocerca flexuosa]